MIFFFLGSFGNGTIGNAVCIRLRRQQADVLLVALKDFFPLSKERYLISVWSIIHVTRSFDKTLRLTVKPQLRLRCRRWVLFPLEGEGPRGRFFQIGLCCLKFAELSSLSFLSSFLPLLFSLHQHHNTLSSSISKLSCEHRFASSGSSSGCSPSWCNP